MFTEYQLCWAKQAGSQPPSSLWSHNIWLLVVLLLFLLFVILAPEKNLSQLDRNQSRIFIDSHDCRRLQEKLQCSPDQLCMPSLLTLHAGFIHSSGDQHPTSNRNLIPFLSSNCKTLKGILICQTASWTLTVVSEAKSDDYQKFLLWTFSLIMAKNTYHEIYFLKIFKVNSTVLL